MQYEEEVSGGSMSRAHDVHDDAIIAFLMFCLEIYQAEQQRKRKLHKGRSDPAVRVIRAAGRP